MDVLQLIKDNLKQINELRYNLSINAELSFKEYKTQKIIIEFFKKLDIETETILDTGVIAKLNSAYDCIAIRADMDALPVNNVFHACGHDYHMAIVAGVALVLKKIGFDKCVKFIFQPGEESSGGALPMINNGVLENPKVKNIIGFHVWPNVNIGHIEVTSEASMASIDDFEICFKGEGGHAAMPHLCKNPIYPAIEFIQSMNIQSKIENNPLDSHVITFSSVNCGNAPNIISDKCNVLGTVRTFNDRLRTKIYEDMLKNAKLCAEKYNCISEVNYDFQYPPLLNDKDLTDKFINITKNFLGEDKVLSLEKTFAGEDFAYFAEKVPAVHFRLGISDGIKGIHPLHSPYFDAADETILNGISVITNFILENYN